MVKKMNNYESAYKKRRRKQKEKAVKLFQELNQVEGMPKGEMWTRLENAVGLNRETIKRDLKEVGLL